jgi:excisionase family DNA binding protein
MKACSTSEAAEKLGMHRVNLQRAIKNGRIPAPKVSKVGGVSVRLWTNQDIERARGAIAKVKG